MRLISGRFLGTALLLVACSNQPHEPIARTSAAIAWVPAGNMSVQRPRSPLVAVLPSGKVFVAGGDGGEMSTEIWHPATKTFSPGPKSDQPVGRDAIWIGPPTNKLFVPIADRGQLFDPTTKTFFVIPTDDTE